MALNLPPPQFRVHFLLPLLRVLFLFAVAIRRGVSQVGRPQAAHVEETLLPRRCTILLQLRHRRRGGGEAARCAFLRHSKCGQRSL
jgi:hypothetical protein